MAIANHVVYLIVSLIFTITVGQTLFRHGRLFLLDCFAGNLRTADAVNRMLLAGFYLVNIGFVGVALRFGDTGKNLQASIEMLSGRIGFVALTMGVMHFHNMFWCEVTRRHWSMQEGPNLGH